ncbi:MAG: hypothetical protein IPJ85_10815 [Flavobacteriales bacterium]|nr:hypothetical protein [Flavobacteriales bacterium]
MGASSAFLYSHHQPRRWVESISIALLTTTVALAAIFLFAMEGLLCIVMAAPIVYPIAITGALVGHALARRTEGGLSTMTMLVLLAPGLMAFEHTNPTNEPLFKVVTSVSVNAPPQTVWDKLVAFSRMNEPDDLLFLAGISYPIEARIEGTGVGACRFCLVQHGSLRGTHNGLR